MPICVCVCVSVCLSVCVAVCVLLELETTTLERHLRDTADYIILGAN